MTGPLRRVDDEALMAELTELLAPVTEPPPSVLAALRELFTWRTVDAELAAMVYDSLLDAAPARTRAAAQPRILVFEAGGLTIEVEVDARPSGRRLLGQLVPGQAAELELRCDGDPIAATADELGRFTMPLPAASQRVSLRCRLRDGTEVETAVTVI